MAPLSEGVPELFSRYYELLQQWNSRLNLTAIRSPEEVLQRHFLECIFCAQHLPEGVETLLDFGSGAGFPGMPIALCRPEIRVTLAESQGKKASFLREVIRSLGMNSEVHAGRAESLPQGLTYGVVTLRAVDKMADALQHATTRVTPGGFLVVLTTRFAVKLGADFAHRELPLPRSNDGVLVIAARQGCST